MLLSEARVSIRHVPRLPGAPISSIGALASAPRTFRLLTSLGGNAIISAAARDVHARLHGDHRPRRRHRRDPPPAHGPNYVRYVKVVSRLCHIASAEHGLHSRLMCDGHLRSYRLFLSLLYGEKPVVTARSPSRRLP